jgi:hypothetical protein
MSVRAIVALQTKIPGGETPPGTEDLTPGSDDQGKKSLCMRIVNAQLLSFDTV